MPIRHVDNRLAECQEAEDLVGYRAARTIRGDGWAMNDLLA